MNLQLTFEKPSKLWGILILVFLLILVTIWLKPLVVQSYQVSIENTVLNPVVYPIELTPGGRKRIGGLADLKDVTAADAIRKRGGGQSQVKQLQTGYENLTVGELANRAAAGDKEAEKALKIVKQAEKKAQKYGGKQ